MKCNVLFTSVIYICESLYCNLKQENGWYSWKQFKEKHYPLKKSTLIEYISKNSSSGKIRLDIASNSEYHESIKFRLIDED